MDLPHTSVFYDREYGNTHHVDTDLRKAKDNIHTLARLFVFSVVLYLLTLGALCGLVINTMQTQRSTDTTIENLQANHVADVATLKNSVTTWKNSVTTLKNSVTTLKNSVTTLTNRINQLEKSNQQMLSRENITDALTTNMDSLKGEFAQRLQTLNITVTTDMDSLKGEYTQRLQTLNTTVLELLEKPKSSDQQVAFAANGATGKTVNTVLTFEKVELNVGDGYNKTTGVFTCPVAGTYLFSATLVSVFIRNSLIECYIRNHNAGDKVMIYSFEGKLDSASVSMVFHLSGGDTVDLGGCSNEQLIETGYGWASFIGSLIQAD